MYKSSRPYTILISLLFFYCSCSSPEKHASPVVIASEKKQIAATLDSFNMAAAKADYNGYFNFYTDDAIFTGTDATERWDKKQFMVWAKPFFDRGKAWSFTALQRNIYFDQTARFAWFDELLNTSMKICRGSGVLVKEGDAWKLKQYILSTTIPNDQLDTILKIKSHVEDSIINTFKR